MSDETQPESYLIAQAVHSQQQAFDVMSKLLTAAQPDSVFSKPVKSGDYTVVFASEVGAGGGFGSALVGNGVDETRRQRSGGGAGGGGGSMGRPVAAIVIGPNGVEIKPVFDRTKILVSLLAAAGGVLMTYHRLRRGR